MRQVNTEEKDIEVIPERPAETIPLPDPMIEEKPARLRILKADLITHGYTKGCIGCRGVMTGVKKIQAHSEECRARIYPLMKANEASRERVNEAEERQADWQKRAKVLGNMKIRK